MLSWDFHDDHEDNSTWLCLNVVSDVLLDQYLFSGPCFRRSEMWENSSDIFTLETV